MRALLSSPNCKCLFGYSQGEGAILDQYAASEARVFCSRVALGVERRTAAQYRCQSLELWPCHSSTLSGAERVWKWNGNRTRREGPRRFLPYSRSIRGIFNSARMGHLWSPDGRANVDTYSSIWFTMGSDFQAKAVRADSRFRDQAILRSSKEVT